MSMLAIYALFFLSGISGLIYQVVWVREFGAVFGNTVYSASIITAVFMGGLGLGSLAIGRFSDRRHAGNPAAAFRAYGICEIAIGVLGLLVALALPRLEPLSAVWSSYQVGAHTWFELTSASYLLRYLSALVLLLPITLLMGGTLTLLIRCLVSGRLTDAGWRIGALYGLNTAGAALGAFLTDFALIPNVGILRTEAIAVGLNLVAGVAAIALAGRVRSTAGHVDVPPDEATDTVTRPRFDPRVIGTSATLFVTGFVAMGFEIIWFRYLISGLGGFRAIFSLLMTVILTGIFCGSILGGFLERRTGRPALLFLIAQSAFIVVALVPMALLGANVFSVIDPSTTLSALSGGARDWIELLINLPAIVAVVGAGSLLMGFTFPLGNAHVQRVEASIGGRAGALYLANTLGNVTGSLVTAFVLLPALGQQASVSLLTVLAAAGLLPLYWTVRRKSPATERVSAWVFGACQLVLIASLAGWLSLPEYHLLKYARTDPSTRRMERVIAIREGINETAVVLERPDGRALYTNGHPMSANDLMARRYMRLFSHIPLLNLEEPESVLVICFGVGTTLHAASLHPSVDRLDVVDLSENVLLQAEHFESGNEGVLRDERVSVHVNDGRQHLRMQPSGRYDLITLEPPPIAFAGVASLYTTEFYRLARSRLSEHGYMTQWLPAYQVPAAVNLSIIRSFLDVFPNASLLSGAERELILIGSRNGDLALDPVRIQRQLARHPRIQRDLDAVGAGTATALIATFVAGPTVLARTTADAPAVTDDSPIMEYAFGTPYTETRLPEALFDGWEIRSWCPGCYVDGRAVDDVAELPRLLEALGAYYHSDAFLAFSNYREPARLPFLPGRPCGLETVQQSVYFRRIFQCERTD